MNTIMKSWAVDDFIVANGLPPKIAKGILLSEADCNRFNEGFQHTNNYAVDDLLDFRDVLLQEQKDLTFSQFFGHCNKRDILDTFTYFFRQHFTLSDIALVKKRIAYNDITLYEIWEKFKANTDRNIMTYIMTYTL